MEIWEMLRGPRRVLKKVKFIYRPYSKIRYALSASKKRKDLQKNGMEAILDADRILNQTNACFFVDDGTLLGFVRDGKLIQWDFDIDFGIYITSDFSWKDLEKTMGKVGFILDHQFRLGNEITEQTYKRGLTSIDFFNHINDENSTVFYSYYSKEGYDYERSDQMHVRLFKTCKISGTKVLQMSNGNVHVPIEDENYLEGLYGASWRTPDPNWKDGSSPACIDLGNQRFGVRERVY